MKSNLIAECTYYDLKQMLERKKVKSWLKTVSAFANTDGGSLFFGVADDHTVIGLQDAQSDAEFISECINDRLDPIPEYDLIPQEMDGHTILELRIMKGIFTPYYYYQDGTRTAFVRYGNESVVATSRQLLALVLKGSNRTWDSLSTNIEKEQHSFIMLANTYRKQTNLKFEDKLMNSWGLVDTNNHLTNAGMLFADDCPVYHSRIFCTRWNGLEKTNALNDTEYSGNLLYLLDMAMSFIRANTAMSWTTQPTYRQNNPDYSERAVFEVIVNHLIHRDYTVMGSEVHIDIYDDRLVVSSPGGMYDGTKIQERDLKSVSSYRRNPIIADVFAQLNYMEKRGSGLRRIQTLTASLPTYSENKQPAFESNNQMFYTMVENVNYGATTEHSKSSHKDEKVHIESSHKSKNVPIESSHKGEKVPIESSHKDEKVPIEISHKDEKVPIESSHKDIKLGKTARYIVERIGAFSDINAEILAEELGISYRAVKRHISNLTKAGIIEREGGKRYGRWKIK